MFIYCSKDFIFLFEYLEILINYKVHNKFNSNTEYYALFGLPTIPYTISNNNKPQIIVLYNNTYDNLDIMKQYNLKHQENYINGILYFYENIESNRDITYITQGIYNIDIYPILICILFIFGNIIHSTWKHLDNFNEISSTVSSNKWRNQYNIYYQTYTTLVGLDKVETEWVIKVRADEFYNDWSIFIDRMKSNSDKIVCNNVYFYYGKRRVYHISDHILGGKTDNIKLMFQNCLNYLQKIEDYPKYIFHAEQILTFSYLLSIYSKEELIYSIDTSRNLLIKHFIVVPITDFIKYCVISNYKGSKLKVTQNNYNNYKFITPIHSIEQI
jgi:hypothetical protein